MKGTATTMTICGKRVKLGDFVRVKYMDGDSMKGGTIQGKIVELWDEGLIQGRVESGWCFHDKDNILQHVPA